MTYIIAHRGASFHAPENTIAAFRKAVEMGADGIETDVQVTADCQLVIHHNYTVDKTSDSTGEIAKMTLAQLKKLDFGIRKGGEFAGERIATLDECLDAVRPLKLVNIELKAPVDRQIPYVEMAVDKIKSHGMVEQTLISSFNHDLLRQVKALCPELRTGALTPALNSRQHSLLNAAVKTVPEDLPLQEITEEDIDLPENGAALLAKTGIRAKNPKAAIRNMLRSLSLLLPVRATLADALALVRGQENLVSYAGSLDFPLDYIHPEYHALLANHALVPKLAKLGIGVSPYTPDSPEDLRTLWAMGCYSIITNRPDRLLKLRDG